MLKRLLACIVMLTAVTVEAAGQAAIKAAQRCARQMEAAGQTAIKTAKCARQNVVDRTRDAALKIVREPISPNQAKIAAQQCAQQTRNVVRDRMYSVIDANEAKLDRLAQLKTTLKNPEKTIKKAFRIIKENQERGSYLRDTDYWNMRYILEKYRNTIPQPVRETTLKELNKLYQEANEASLKNYNLKNLQLAELEAIAPELEAHETSELNRLWKSDALLREDLEALELAELDNQWHKFAKDKEPLFSNSTKKAAIGGTAAAAFYGACNWLKEKYDNMPYQTRPDLKSLKREWLRPKVAIEPTPTPDFGSLKDKWSLSSKEKQQLRQAFDDISTYGSGTASPKLNELKKGWCPPAQQQRFQKAFAEKQARLEYLRNTLANRENLQKEVVGRIREYNDMGAKLREKHTEQYRNRPPFSYDEHEESYFERALNWLNQKQGKEKSPDVVEQVYRDWRKMDDDLQVHRNKQAERETVQEAKALSELNEQLEKMKRELKANTFDLEDAQ